MISVAQITGGGDTAAGLTVNDNNAPLTTVSWFLFKVLLALAAYSQIGRFAWAATCKHVSPPRTWRSHYAEEPAEFSIQHVLSTGSSRAVACRVEKPSKC